MSKQFKFFDPGEGLEEAEVLEINVSAGDSVNDGDVILTVETDKAAAEVPAPFNGQIESVEVSEGQSVRVGDVLLTYQQASESGAEGENESKTAASGESAANRPSDKQAQSPPEKTSQAGGQQESETYAEKREASSSKSRSRHGHPVPAAPSTRRLASELGVDLHEVTPSGPHGRVVQDDVQAAASGSGQRQSPTRGAATRSLTPATTPAPLPDFSQWGTVEREPLRSVRRSTALNMARAWAEIPHVFHQDVADVTELERFRQHYAETAQAEGGHFSLTVLVMKALVHALKRFPRFNASLDADNEEIIFKHYFHIGLAVATDRGLLVPIVRDVDRKNLIELTAEIGEVVERARAGKATRGEMQGGSITLTNPGPMGGTGLTPLINAPQVAIVGMASARLQSTVIGDIDDWRTEPRLHLPLCLGFDHRVNDGADAARFVTTLIETLQDPRSLAMRI